MASVDVVPAFRAGQQLEGLSADLWTGVHSRPSARVSGEASILAGRRPMPRRMRQSLAPAVTRDASRGRMLPASIRPNGRKSSSVDGF